MLNLTLVNLVFFHILSFVLKLAYINPPRFFRTFFRFLQSKITEFIIFFSEMFVMFAAIFVLICSEHLPKIFMYLYNYY